MQQYILQETLFIHHITFKVSQNIYIGTECNKMYMYVYYKENEQWLYSVQGKTETMVS